MPPYCRLCDVTQPKLNMQNQIVKCFNNNFATNFYNLLILVTCSHFPKINHIYENNNLYETNFNFNEISLNIQNGGSHSTNVKVFNFL